MVMECSYAVTAWTQAVEDEHRLLSQVLAIFYAYPELPQESLNGRLANGSQAWPIKARIGQGKGEKSDFWSAVGGQYKVSLDYVVRLSVESGAELERGPEVRTQTVRTLLSDGPARAVVEMHRCVGRVSRQEGRAARPTSGSRSPTSAPGPPAPPTGASASTACRRAATGYWRGPPTASEADAQLEVPGSGVDLVVGEGMTERVERIARMAASQPLAAATAARKGWGMANEPRPCVLLGNLGPIMRLGMTSRPERAGLPRGR